jgi:hypothetical protein
MTKDPNGYHKGINWKPRYTRMVLVITRSVFLELAKCIELIIKDNDTESIKDNGNGREIPAPPKANVTAINKPK